MKISNPSRNVNTTVQLLNRLRMRQVALMLTVDARRTLRAAAAELGMTQPAATKMLRELEDTLGQPLFDRVGRGLKLNAAGACVTNYFRGMRGNIESLNRELQELRLGSSGKLLIGSIMAAAPDHLTEALVRIKEALPLLAVEIFVGTSDRLMAQLREGVLDVVIGRLLGSPGAPLHGEYLFRPLADEALSVIAARDHPLAKRRSVSFDAMLTYPWILQPPGSPMRDVIEQEFRGHDAPLPRGLIETSSILTTTNLVARSQMIAVIPRSVASRYETHGLLRILRYDIRNRLSSYGSIVRRDRPTGAATFRFLQLLHIDQGGLDVRDDINSR
jgi:DNA-binding transcriptional LysR family regulator